MDQTFARIYLQKIAQRKIIENSDTSLIPDLIEAQNTLHHLKYKF